MDAGTVPQDQENVIVRQLIGPPCLQFGVGHRGRTEQLQRLVNQVAAKVEEDPAPVRDGGPRLPGLGDGGLPAFEPGLEPGHLAQGPGGEQFPQGQEITVPPPVVEHRQHPAQLPCHVNKFLSLRTGHGERLVHHNVQPRLQRRPGQGKVGCRRRRQDHQVKVNCPPKDGGAVAYDVRPRKPGCGSRLPPGVGRGNDVQRIAAVGCQQRGVEHAPCKPVADDGGADDAGVAFSSGHESYATPGRAPVDQVPANKKPAPLV